MNIFVLSTGRCGSLTFCEACSHISNYSAAHESRSRILGDSHFDYPANHIEIDNRLSWFLGRVDTCYGKDAFYVHLTRDVERVAASYSKRFGSGIMRGYAKALMMGHHPRKVAMELARDYCKTVNANIDLFLKDKPLKLSVSLEQVLDDFPIFWDRIGAQGDLGAALAEWGINYNKSKVQFSLWKKRD